MHFNLSTIDVGVEVQPGTEMSFDYAYGVDPTLQPLDYNLEIAVDMTSENDDELIFTNPAFNSTITTVDISPIFDGKLLFIAVVTFGGIGFGVYSWIAPSLAKQKKRALARAAKMSSSNAPISPLKGKEARESVKSEWIQNTGATQNKPKSRGRKA
eukprot:TRINITY_DN18420_c0_g1_i1.p1 TRINITY_DN18420_c0_g1~~TRINITY_DN18420_c0_g1_i1.p1  ORF type:complete len:156 (+),score=70.56 TRINITY_DN18420_c0_g1_i1:252-719(+)